MNISRNQKRAVHNGKNLVFVPFKMGKDSYNKDVLVAPNPEDPYGWCAACALNLASVGSRCSFRTLSEASCMAGLRNDRKDGYWKEVCT